MSSVLNRSLFRTLFIQVQMPSESVKLLQECAGLCKYSGYGCAKEKDEIRAECNFHDKFELRRDLVVHYCEVVSFDSNKNITCGLGP